MNEQEITRARILGALICDARLHAGRSAEECARALEIPPDTFAEIEAGEQVVSLPQLEVLAIYLRVSLSYFWGGQTLATPEEPDYSMLLSLRHRMLGAQLRQARQDSGLTVDELALASGVPADQIRRYETAPEAISLFELETLGKALNMSLDDFIYTERGPLARHEQSQKQKQQFEQLPSEMKAFVTQPTNIAYLETAIRLSEMDTQRLRQIAERILDITL